MCPPSRLEPAALPFRQQMTADHDTLDSLRRVTVKNGATRAEAATARRLAKALGAKLGRRPNRRPDRADLALPEPSWARKRRIWANWIERVLWGTGALGAGAFAIYFLLTLAMILSVVFAGTILNDLSYKLVQAKIKFLTAVGLFGCVVVIPLAIALWWLRAEPGTRLKSAGKFICHATPFIAIGILWLILFDQAEKAMRHMQISFFWFLLALLIWFATYELALRAWCRWGVPALHRMLWPMREEPLP